MAGRATKRKNAPPRFLPPGSKAQRYKVMFSGTPLGRTFDSKIEAQAVAAGLNKTMPGSATVIRANPNQFQRKVSPATEQQLRLMGVGSDKASIAAAIAKTQSDIKTEKVELSRIISYAPGDKAMKGAKRAQIKGLVRRLRVLKTAARHAQNPGAFKRCVKAVAAKGKAVSPAGVCAAAGRKKYGKKKFQQMALAGKRAKRNAATGHKAVRAFFKTNDIDIIFNADPHRAMATLSSKTGIGHGVEHIDAKEFRRGAPGAASVRGIDYVNMGDPYTKTLIHDGTKFVLGAWGDWVEKYRARKQNSSMDELTRIKQQIIELQERHDKRPTRDTTDRLTALRAKFMKASRDFMTASRRGVVKNATDFSLYDAAKKADDAFQAALVKQFGSRAGDMRYRSGKHPAHIKALAKAKQKSDERWLAEMRRQNPKLLTSIGQGAVRADVYELKGGTHQVRLRGEKPKDFESAKGAMSYARLRVHERAQNPSPMDIMYADQMIEGKHSLIGKVMRRLQGKKNPEAAAEQMYQMFHGIEPAKVIVYRQTEHVHEWLWAVGTLVSLHVSNGKKKLTFTAPDPIKSKVEDVVMLACTEGDIEAHRTDKRIRVQLYFRGGDQSLPLDEIAEEFGMTDDDMRELMLIGEVVQMTYRTRKVFESGGKDNVNFFHDHGQEHADGHYPSLLYKPLNPSIDLVGGRYAIAPFDKSIGASPGIVG